MCLCAVSLCDFVRPLTRFAFNLFHSDFFFVTRSFSFATSGMPMVSARDVFGLVRRCSWFQGVSASEWRVEHITFGWNLF